MSRIYEALRTAENVRRERPGEPAQKKRAEAKPAASQAAVMTGRRRSRRWAIDVVVFVYGHSSAKNPFYEEAHTIGVNAYGGLLLMSSVVRKGQKLLLANKRTQMELECTVINVGKKHSKTVEVGIEFLKPHPEFWQIPARQAEDEE